MKHSVSEWIFIDLFLTESSSQKAVKSRFSFVYVDLIVIALINWKITFFGSNRWVLKQIPVQFLVRYTFRLQWTWEDLNFVFIFYIDYWLWWQLKASCIWIIGELLLLFCSLGHWKFDIDNIIIYKKWFQTYNKQFVILIDIITLRSLKYLIYQL
jgi:hypothetical protein